MHIQVYHSRTNYEAADALVASLREAGEYSPISQGRSDRWDGTVEGDALLHDGSNRAIVAAYEAAGVPCEIFGEALTNVEILAPELKAEPADKPESEAGQSVEVEPAALPDGYAVEAHGSWRHVLAPDGEVVGKTRSDEEAAQIAADHATSG